MALTSHDAPESVRVFTGYASRSKRWIGDPSSNTSFDGPVPIDRVRDELFGWEVIESGPPVFPVDTPDGTVHVTDSTRKGMVRSDTHALFGIFKNGYRPHQFDDVLVDNVSQLLDDPDLGIESAGWARYGALGWVQVGLNETRTVPGTDVEYRPFLNAWSSHDGSKATGYNVGTNAIICDNMVMGVLRQADYKIKHSRNSGIKLAEAREALGLVLAVADDFDEKVAELVNTHVSDRQWQQFLDAHVPMPEIEDGQSTRSLTIAENTRGQLNQLYRHDERAATWNGTAYGVLAAVNTWNQHFRTVRGADRTERAYVSAMNGTTAQADAAALDTLHAVLV